MSKATKRKHVVKEVLDDYVLPEGDQEIVKVLAGRGNNLHEIETATGEKYLVSMPTKFRKNVWIKRGDFVIVEPIEEGDKVKAEIHTILYKDQIKYIKEEGLWPKQFEEKEKSCQDNYITSELLPPSDGESDSDVENDLVLNMNRVNIHYEESETESSEEEECDETAEAGMVEGTSVNDM